MARNENPPTEGPGTSRLQRGLRSLLSFLFSLKTLYAENPNSISTKIQINNVEKCIQKNLDKQEKTR